MLDLNMLDYQETNFNYEAKIPSFVKLTAAEAKKVPELRLRLKNATMHYLFQGRKMTNQNSLVQILEIHAKGVRQKQ
jgi:hypothetical protein